MSKTSESAGYLPLSAEAKDAARERKAREERNMRIYANEPGHAPPTKSALLTNENELPPGLMNYD